jgi:hypothetical protein
MRSLAFCLAIAFAVLSGCRVPPRAGDASLPPRSINTPLLTAPAVRVHVAAIGDAQIPEAAFSASLATLSRHIRRPIEVYRHPSLPAEPPDSDVVEIAGEFPVYQDTRLVTRDDFLPAINDRSSPVYTLPAPDHGILGVAGIPTSSDPQSGKIWLTLRPIVEPDVILVLGVPGSRNGLGYTGFTDQVVKPGGAMRNGLVVLRQSAIERRSGVFVPANRLWEWTLTHEVGHVLGVPINNSHSEFVRGYGGIHCTHPECVMSTGVDLRTIVSGVVNGWPVDYCDRCSSEIRAAYGPDPPTSGTDRPGPDPAAASGMGVR